MWVACSLPVIRLAGGSREVSYESSEISGGSLLEVPCVPLDTPVRDRQGRGRRTCQELSYRELPVKDRVRPHDMKELSDVG